MAQLIVRTAKRFGEMFIKQGNECLYKDTICEMK